MYIKQLQSQLILKECATVYCFPSSIRIKSIRNSATEQITRTHWASLFCKVVSTFSNFSGPSLYLNCFDIMFNFNL